MNTIKNNIKDLLRNLLGSYKRSISNNYYDLLLELILLISNLCVLGSMIYLMERSL